MSKNQYQLTLLGQARHLDPSNPLSMETFHIGVIEGDTVDEIFQKIGETLHKFANAWDEEVKAYAQSEA